MFLIFTFNGCGNPVSLKKKKRKKEKKLAHVFVHPSWFSKVKGEVKGWSEVTGSPT